MIKIEKRKGKGLICLGLAFSLAAGSVSAAFAEENQAQQMERLKDNQMEYDELSDLIKNYYPPIKSAYDTINSMKDDNSQAILESRLAASSLLDEADQIKADASGGSPEEKAAASMTAKVLRSNAKSLKSYADSAERGLDSYDSQIKTLDRNVNSIVYNVEKLMNTYQQTLAMRQVAAKGAEIAQAATNLQATMQAQGLSVDRDVLSAAASLSSASQQLASVDQGLEQLKKTLCTFTGWGAEGHPQIGAVPSADVASIASIDVERDKEKAALNNYEMISLRSGSGGNMSQLASQLTKSTTKTKNKLRDVQYGEETVKSQVQTLYDVILEKKALYDSALTAYQSAQISWNGAQLQRQSGSLSDIQFMQQELAYLQAEANFKCADLALQQAMRDYDWAVRGVTVSAA